VSVAAQESTKLYALLQTAVDNEIQQFHARRQHVWHEAEPER
jgi:hypothetical protein